MTEAWPGVEQNRHFGRLPAGIRSAELRTGRPGSLIPGKRMCVAPALAREFLLKAFAFSPIQKQMANRLAEQVGVRRLSFFQHSDNDDDHGQYYKDMNEATEDLKS